MALNYTSVDRIQALAPKLADAKVMQNSRLTGYAEDAEAEVDSAIAGKYEVPVSGTPAILRAVATDIAIYRALRDVFSFQQLKDSEWPMRFKESRDLLKKIAEGDMLIVASDGTVVDGRTDIREVHSNTMDYEQTMTELGPLEDIVDCDKVDDLRDERDLGITDFLK